MDSERTVKNLIKPKVLITQEQRGQDYGDAQKYGELVFITDREYASHGNSLINRAIMRKIRDAMEGWSLENDYLVLTGNQITICYAFFLAMHKHRAMEMEQDRIVSIQILQWDNRRNEYRLIEFKGQ